MIYPVFGKYEKALEQANKAIELDPEFVVHYIVLGGANASVGRLEEADNVLRRASERKLEMADLLVLRYGIALFKR